MVDGDVMNDFKSLGNAVQLIATETFHSDENIAFCESKELAYKITKCMNAHDDLVKVLKLSNNVLEALHAAEPRDDARKMLGELIMANRAVLEKAGAV